MIGERIKNFFLNEPQDHHVPEQFSRRVIEELGLTADTAQDREVVAAIVTHATKVLRHAQADALYERLRSRDAFVRALIAGIACVARERTLHGMRSHYVSRLDQDVVQELVDRYGLRVLAYLNFSGASFHHYKFHLNARDAILDDVYFGYAYLGAMDLSHATLRSIRVGETYESAQSVDLERDAVMLRESIPLKLAIADDAVHAHHCQEVEGRCQSAEKSLLRQQRGHHSSQHRIAGVLVTAGDIPIGFVKGYGEKSLIALRTVYSPNGRAILRRGQVCALGVGSKFARALILSASSIRKMRRDDPYAPDPGTWYRYDIGRYTHDDPMAEVYLRVLREYKLFAKDQQAHGSLIDREHLDHIPLTPMRFLSDPNLFATLERIVHNEEIGGLPSLNAALADLPQKS